MTAPVRSAQAIAAECHEEVSRRGEAQPCDKTAVALRIDPNEGTPYPVCAYHARAEMVPLTDIATDPADAVLQAAVGEARRLLRCGLFSVDVTTYGGQKVRTIRATDEIAYDDAERVLLAAGTSAALLLGDGS